MTNAPAAATTGHAPGTGVRMEDIPVTLPDDIAAATSGDFESSYPLPDTAQPMRVRHGIVQELREGTARWHTDHGPALLLPGIHRHRDPSDDRPLHPNPALVRALDPSGQSGARRLPDVRFASIARRGPSDRIGGYTIAQVPVDLGAVSLYGTGEVPGRLLRNGTSVTCWNWDRPAYSEASESLYQSHPWVLGVRDDGSAFGVMCETTHCCEIDLRKDITFRCLSFTGRPPVVSVLTIERDTPAEVLMALAELTGTMPMPPRWALGYHQCRWSYYPDTRVQQLAQEFRDRMVPCDVIWMDIDYMEGYRVFSFSEKHFPRPEALAEWLHERGFRTVYMIDPGVRVDDDDPVYRSGYLGDHFVRDPDGKPFHGLCWPGRSAWPDFTRERTRTWWASHYKAFMARGVDGVWNDMNEPSVFRRGAHATTMPETCRHEADAELGGPDTHDRYHNVYGMQMVRATREGIARAQPDRRPFVLTRANFIGGHRYAATWTGDNISDWEHLSWSIPMVLNLGLSGQPFSGPDIGGFCNDATPELFARWMGIGAMMPFARAHSAASTRDHEPWSFGERVLATCRHAIERRMRLMPYLYTLFRESSATGLPIARPLFFADPRDLGLRDADDAFLLGDDLLIRASHRRESPTSSSRLPKGTWRRFDLIDRAFGDPDLPSMRIRGGAIIPTGPVMQHTGELPLDPLTLVVCLDPSGRASGRLYEDAGDGFGYQRGEYRLTTYSAEVEHNAVVVRTERVEGAMAKADRVVRIRLITADDRSASVEGRDGDELRVPMHDAVTATRDADHLEVGLGAAIRERKG